MKPRFAFVAAALAAGLALASAGARAQPMEGDWQHDGLALLRGIGLSDAQKEQIRQIVKTERTQMEPTIQKLRAVHEQLEGRLLGADQVNEEQLQPLVQQAEELRSEIDSERLAIALQVRAVLTAPQLAQAATMHQRLADLHRQEHALLGGAHPQP